MATEVTYNGDGSDTTFDITFPFLKSTDVKVQVGGTTKNNPSDFTVSGTVVTFTTAPPSGTGNIRIYRNTDKAAAKHSFNAGSSIKAEDLNNNVLQALYSLQEIGTVTSNDEGLGLTAGSKGDIHVNSGTDWYIKDDAVDSNMLNTNSVTNDAIANNAVDTLAITDNAVTMAKLNSGALPTDITVASANLVDGTIATADIADQAITQAKINNAVIFTPIGTVIWYAGSTAPTGYLKCNGDTIANGSGTTQSITADFSALYAIVGANLPDLRGEFIRGFDDGKGTDSGRSIRSTQSDDFKEHTHTASVTDPGHAHTFDSHNDDNADGNTLNDRSNLQNTRTMTSSSETTGISVSNANTGGTATRPRNIALLACIKY